MDPFAIIGLICSTLGVLVFVYSIPKDYAERRRAKVALQVFTVICSMTMAASAAEMGYRHGKGGTQTVADKRRMKTAHALETVVASKPEDEAAAKLILFEAALARIRIRNEN